MKRRWNSISGGTLLVLARPTRSGLLRDSRFNLFGDWGEPPLPRGKLFLAYEHGREMAFFATEHSAAKWLFSVGLVVLKNTSV